jgi:hypothetical protein
MKHWQVAAILTVALALIRSANGQTNNEPQAQGSTNIDCVERLEIPRYPPLATAARIEASITASVALSSNGAVQDITVTAESRYRPAKDLFGPPESHQSGAIPFRLFSKDYQARVSF